MHLCGVCDETEDPPHRMVCDPYTIHHSQANGVIRILHPHARTPGICHLADERASQPHRHVIMLQDIDNTDCEVADSLPPRYNMMCQRFRLRGGRYPATSL